MIVERAITSATLEAIVAIFLWTLIVKKKMIKIMANEKEEKRKMVEN